MAPHGGQEELILLIEHGGKFARELGEAPPPTIPRPSPNRRRRRGPRRICRRTPSIAPRADVTLEGEEDVSEAQKAKREKAQRLMRQFQEQAENRVCTRRPWRVTGRVVNAPQGETAKSSPRGGRVRGRSRVPILVSLS